MLKLLLLVLLQRFQPLLMLLLLLIRVSHARLRGPLRRCSSSSLHLLQLRAVRRLLLLLLRRWWCSLLRRRATRHVPRLRKWEGGEHETDNSYCYVTHTSGVTRGNGVEPKPATFNTRAESEIYISDMD